MSKNGGYRIIDLQNKQLTQEVGMIYPGIHSAIEGTRKRIVFSGLNIGGTEYHDIEAVPTVSGTSFVFNVPLGASTLTITVTDVDALTVVITVPVEDEPTVPDDEI